MSRTHTSIASLSVALVPVLVGASLFELWIYSYGATLCLVLGIVLLMELRVRLGYTLPRGALFYLHVVAGILLLGILGVLWRGYSPSVLYPAAWAAYALMLSTGGMLLWRTMQRQTTATQNK